MTTRTAEAVVPTAFCYMCHTDVPVPQGLYSMRAHSASCYEELRESLLEKAEALAEEVEYLLSVRLAELGGPDIIEPQDAFTIGQALGRLRQWAALGEACLDGVEPWPQVTP